MASSAQVPHIPLKSILSGSVRIFKRLNKKLESLLYAYSEYLKSETYDLFMAYLDDITEPDEFDVVIYKPKDLKKFNKILAIGISIVDYGSVLTNFYRPVLDKTGYETYEVVNDIRFVSDVTIASLWKSKIDMDVDYNVKYYKKVTDLVSENVIESLDGISRELNMYANEIFFDFCKVAAQMDKRAERFAIAQDGLELVNLHDNKTVDEANIRVFQRLKMNLKALSEDDLQK
nr:hypothetical protein [Palo verde broom virus]WEC26238.1 hypothetical protein [Emaravirus parkinsoniae]UWT50532.1 hypothetical protein [Palo verde broom virus]WEC26239.1 hypothetical protein [Emaravirus parkinsoniae]WEC26240.1 hypothetical protein [Emaravirus parkinsoniae]